jgi:hypothetical protein
MSSFNFLNYLDLTEEQKAKADFIVYTLGSSLDDKIFIVIDNGVEALNNHIFQMRFTPGTHHQFCLHCRKTYPADEPHPDDECPQEYLTQFKLNCFDQAKACEDLQTLREQFESMAITSV